MMFVRTQQQQLLLVVVPTTGGAGQNWWTATGAASLNVQQLDGGTILTAAVSVGLCS